MDINSSHESVVIVFPQMDQDSILAMLHEKEALPDNYRKYFIGPLTGPDGSRIYMLVHDGVNSTFPMRVTISKITTLARNLNKNVSIVRVAFGGKDKQTRVIESSDPKIVSDEDVNIRLKMSLLEGTNKILKNQLVEIQRLRDRDILLSEALTDLEYLRRQKDLLAAVTEAGKELRTGVLSDQSSQRIVALLDEIEKLKAKRKTGTQEKGLSMFWSETLDYCH